MNFFAVLLHRLGRKRQSADIPVAARIQIRERQVQKPDLHPRC